jgi:ubiquinone/menaquinone biosynthesis C-methylase UbiE
MGVNIQKTGYWLIEQLNMISFTRLKGNGKMTARDPKQIVAQGFDRIAEKYEEWSRHTRVEERERYTSLVIDHLQAGSAVLDLGCGSGIPTTARFAQHFTVTGVDISARQIDLARQKVPHATFIQFDIAQIAFPANRFDAVVAFYSLFCLPRTELASVVQKIASWLRPGGYFVAALGAQSVEELYSPDWLGVPMYWSLFESEVNKRLLHEAGFTIISAEEEMEEEDGVPITFLWVVAQKPQ